MDQAYQKLHAIIDLIDDQVSNNSTVFQALLSIVRYSQFLGYELDGTQKEITDSEKKEFAKGMIEEDVIDAYHGKYTAELFLSLMQLERESNTPSPENLRLLVIALTLHDIGEAEVGDILYGTKTSEDEELELTKRSKIINSIFGNYKIITSEEQIIISQIIEGKHSDQTLNELFNLTERVGYLLSGLKAWESYCKSDSELEAIEVKKTNNVIVEQAYLRSAVNVMANQISKLTDYSQKYRSIKVILSWKAVQIKEIIEGGNSIESATNYDKTSILESKLEKAQQAIANLTQSK